MQAGSYVFMDADYGRNLDADGNPVSTFRHSLFVLATVISAGFAYVSWHFIEKPALGWKPRRKRESTEIHPQSIDLPLATASLEHPPGG